MIGKLRRILVQPVQEERDWSLDDPLQLDAEGGLETTPDDRPPLQSDLTGAPGSIEAIKGDRSYYVSFVKSCIESGGRFGEHEISTRWLHMILAGLEGKEPGPEVSWVASHELDHPGKAPDERLYWELFREKLTV